MIMVAPSGARRQQSDHPALPITLDEILDTATACSTAGADALHLHVREDDGSHSLDTGRYREAIDALAQRLPDLRIQITTESVGIYSPAEQHHCLSTLQPDWASVCVREIAADPAVAARLYRDCAEQGTAIQHILFGPSCAAQLTRWWQDGTVAPTQNAVIHVLGQYADSIHGTPEDVPARRALIDTDDWMVCAFGDQEHACLAAAHAAGGDLRVGLENSLGLGGDHRWADNAESVTALRARLNPAGN